MNRATKSSKELWPGCQCSSCGSIQTSSYEITFRTDKSILLTGIGLYTGHKGSKYDVDIAIKKGISLLEKKITVPPAENLIIFKFAFDKSIAISPHEEYIISVLAFEAIGYTGYGSQRSITAGDVVFNISSIICLQGFAAVTNALGRNLKVMSSRGYVATVEENSWSNALHTIFKSLGCIL